MTDVLAAAQAAALTWWQSLLIGIAGSVVTLAGVIITLSFNRRNELAKLRHEIEKREIEERREKVSRLRPNRVELLFEVGRHLPRWQGTFYDILGRAEYDDSLDWDALLGDASNLVQVSSDIGIRLRLLFADTPLETTWNEFQRILIAMDSVIKLHPQTHLVLSEEQRRKYWGEVCKHARSAQAKLNPMHRALRVAMQRIDSE